ncbi:autotransporter-associated beta strand repeat-containing protein [Chitinophagaceae bacterium MMS25-I14]
MVLLQEALHAQGVLPANRYYNKNTPTLTWDANTTTDGQVSNASNTWAATTTWVKYPPAGTNVAWAAGSNALFGGNTGVNAAGTVTISGTQSVRNLSFNPAVSGNFTLTGGTALSLTGGTSFINTATGTSPTIAASLQGSNNVVKMGNGSLTLTGINSYSGVTDINLGTVNCSNTADWGALPSGAVNVNAGVLNISANYPYFGTSGSNWQLNNNGNVTPTIASNVLTLTTNSGNQAASAFYKCKVRVDGDFKATFTYTPSGDIAADGVAFILQNSDVAALGGGGGSMGYSVISNSFGLVFNIYNGHQIGMNVGTNGAINYGSVSPVVMNSGNAINVTATYSYSAKTLTVNLAEQGTTHTFSTTYTSVDLPATLGSVVGWIGFSGATGGSQSTQKISNFIFQDRAWNINVNTPAASYNSGNITLGSAPNLAGKIFNIMLTGTGTGFTWTAANWTGTATGTPILQLNGTTVTSGVASGGTTITYSATAGVTVTR